MRIKITELSKRDNYFNHDFVGKTGTGEIKDWKDGWFYCAPFTFEDGTKKTLFEFKYIEVPEPSAMSELTSAAKRAGLDVSTYEYDFTTPKKLSWIKKVRGYDKLESMLSEALRDRDLHAKVADNWQVKLVEANCRKENLQIAADVMLKELNSYGRRIKFSVGHNHIEIIIGNPTTYIENCNTEKDMKFQWNVSRCSTKDTYNWKTGVIEALDNLCYHSEYADKLRRDLRKELAKKCPEVFRD
jgi:hypothetical protein